MLSQGFLKYVVKLLIIVNLLTITNTFAFVKQSPVIRNYEVVVYGGTASGVIAAIAAAREGAKVVILEPKEHIGGLVTGGLSATDLGRRSVIGGYPLEFYKFAGKYYNYESKYNDSIGWFPEPHVAEFILNKMLTKAGVTVCYQKRLREKSGVQTKNGNITSLFTEDGYQYKGKVFIDATYEGDLMAFAGVSYIVGRESITAYNENLAGVRVSTGSLSAYDDEGKLLPETQTMAPGAFGSADNKTQPYNFRLILTDVPDNLVPFEKPKHYDRRKYIDLLRTTLASIAKTGATEAAEQLYAYMGKVPNHKIDLNVADYVGGSWSYPDGNYARRKEIWADHVDYVAGYIYFLGHDEQLPKTYRDVINSWGLAKDEFTDNHYWPYELYVREGRRMIGSYIFNQQDVTSDTQKPNSIGLGSYGLDVHTIQAWATPEGILKWEGRLPWTEKVRSKHIPYQIPYDVLLPKRTEIKNLLVTVCLSASHIAYSTLRMEPQYMILGQAAGTAAYLAIKQQKPVQDIDQKVLVEMLRTRGAYLESDIKTLNDFKPGMGID